METIKKIIHVDMDAFFAQVEQRDNPSLKGKPVVVGSDGKRGVVAAASYEARKFGIRSAMPGFQAKQLCPQLIFVRGNFSAYKEASTIIRSIFHEYSDLVEPLSLDEAFIDVTNNKKGLPSATIIAKQIKAKILEQTHLTASAGVSFNKFLAKIASAMNKPNGLTVITPDKANEILNTLPIEKFFGIGRVTAQKMKGKGIHYGSDLLTYSKIELTQMFGKQGAHYYEMVRANDHREVRTDHIRKSIGAERTFAENITDIEEMRDKINTIATHVLSDMEKINNYGRTLTLKAKSPDFQIITRSKTLNYELTTLAQIQEIAHDLLASAYQEFTAVRLLGLTVSTLRNENLRFGRQLTFDF